MKNIGIQRQKDRLIIGDMPQLVVDLKDQNNYIITQDRTIPYRSRVELSADLLAGKREAVMRTAINYYYAQACQVAEGMKIAEEYRRKVNIKVREIRKKGCNDDGEIKTRP